MDQPARSVTPDERVLSPAQRRVLRYIGGFTRKRGFYLGGGTAIALLLGHRRSVDFDWFTSATLDDPLALAREIQDTVRDAGATFETSSLEPGTLHGSISGINLSFLRYRYRRLRPLLDWPDIPCRLASLDDLACMKLGAAVQRGTRKDFVDVYALGTAHRPLRELLRLYQRKFGIADPGHVLVGLAYFDDAERTPMPPMLWHVPWRTIRATIENWLTEISG